MSVGGAGYAGPWAAPFVGADRSYKYPVTATGTCFLICFRSGTMISLHKLGDVGCR
jgi:hypothetical protein